MFDPGLSGMLFSSLGWRTIELTGTTGIWSLTRTLPDGLGALPAIRAAITSSGESPYERSRSGSTLTTIARGAPPNGGGVGTPGRLAEIRRTRTPARARTHPPG